MRDKLAAFNLYRQCKTFGKAPSVTFGIRRNPWLGWMFDNAILTWGTHVEARLAERTPEGKPKYNARQALGLPMEVKPVSVGYWRQFSNVQVD